ncbi:hypothetical protein RRG08_065865 [Elysia crispata]|uniref:D-dopachrome decarboxylase n=1 Tax=Elysia crispata TaxID=231223 RepID=A0AAE1DU15_9GAST|nr:hypothetical protein RRG08_065865 [Elysia crispata]
MDLSIYDNEVWENLKLNKRTFLDLDHGLDKALGQVSKEDLLKSQSSKEFKTCPKSEEMPLCQLYTSRKDVEIKEGIEMRMSETVARALGKPLERVTMAVLPGTRLFRLGSLAPSALLVIASIKVFDAQRNPTYTPVIKEALQTELDLPADRCLIQYVDLDANFIG